MVVGRRFDMEMMATVTTVKNNNCNGDGNNGGKKIFGIGTQTMVDFVIFNN